MAAKKLAHIAVIKAPVRPATTRLEREGFNSDSRHTASAKAAMATAPNTQRKNTAVSGCWPASERKMPSVPISRPPATRRVAGEGEVVVGNQGTHAVC
jgi:hypothetical protein